jgi:hypothetical protein
MALDVRAFEGFVVDLDDEVGDGELQLMRPQPARR